VHDPVSDRVDGAGRPHGVGERRPVEAAAGPLDLVLGKGPVGVSEEAQLEARGPGVDDQDPRAA
jgi:hypothetical protein